ERAGAGDGGAPRHQRRHAGHEQQLLGLGEGLPEALLPRPLHRLRHRQPALRRLREALRSRRLLRGAPGPDRRRDEGRLRLRQAGDRRDPDRSRRVPDPCAGGPETAPRPPTVGRAPAEPWRASGSVSAAQVLHDTTVVTGDEAGTILYDAALLIERGRIAALGPRAQILAQRPDAERVDARGCAVFPGFANTHTHLPRVLARGIYEDLSPPHEPPFTGGLAPLPLPKTSPEEDRVLALLGALEAIRSGTTLVLEEGQGLDVYAGALADTGLRLVLCERAW